MRLVRHPFYYYNSLLLGYLEKLWAYLNIQQLMDQYELNKLESSYEKSKALELALKVSCYYGCSFILIHGWYYFNMYILFFSIHLLLHLRL